MNLNDKTWSPLLLVLVNDDKMSQIRSKLSKTSNTELCDLTQCL